MIETIKITLFHFSLLFMFSIFLIFPLQTLNGAAAGLLLWYNVLLPSLLPFIILTSIIVKTHAFSILSSLIGPTLGKLFWVSKEGSLAIIIGFLCGYPMGAKIINDLYEDQLISIKEAQYLLSFCNNTSPMFIFSFFLLQILESTTLLLPVLLSLYLAPLVISVFTRRFYKIQKPSTTVSSSEFASTNHNHINQKFSFLLLDEVIIDSITLILKIGGYIMLFSIFINLALPFVSTYIPKLLFLVPMLEVTTGLEIYKNTFQGSMQFIFMIFLVSFGGLCSVGQTSCVLTSSKIKIKHYFVQKIITAIIAVIINSLYLFFIHNNPL